MNQTINMSSIEIQQENARFMSGVYKWMTIGILLTAFISYYVSRSPELINIIVMNKIVFYGLIIAQLGAVFYLSIRIQKMSAISATIIYLAYAALTGLTLSVIFLIYTQDSIEQVFMITAFAFAGLSAFGYFTKKDLGPIGTFCTMGLFGLVGFSLITLFFPSIMTSQVSMIYGVVGVIIFSGLTAYDTQKIKASNILGNEGTAEDHKETIFGALTLYLDFINLFLMLLRLMGGKRK